MGVSEQMSKIIQTVLGQQKEDARALLKNDLHNSDYLVYKDPCAKYVLVHKQKLTFGDTAGYCSHDS